MVLRIGGGTDSCGPEGKLQAPLEFRSKQWLYEIVRAVGGGDKCGVRCGAVWSRMRSRRQSRLRNWVWRWRKRSRVRCRMRRRV